MLLPPRKLDYLRNSGRQVLTAFVLRNYDYTVDFTTLNLASTTAMDSDGVTPIRTVTVTPQAGSQYFGATEFSFVPLSFALAGLEGFSFTIAVRLPATADDIINAVQLKYGVVLDLEDLAPTSATVLATAYGLNPVPVYQNSIRFALETFSFNLIAPAS